jgi:hypothetical protein
MGVFVAQNVRSGRFPLTLVWRLYVDCSRVDDCHDDPRIRFKVEALTPASAATSFQVFR